MEQETNDNAFKVKTSSFEGPFNLLLSLVEEKKLFINDLSLAEVTEDFLKHVTELGNLRPDEISAFVSVAATLILIKSKSLLPNLNLTEEEKTDISSLEIRLKLYEIFTKLGETIKQEFGKQIIFAPLERKSNVLVFLPDEQITKESMMTFAESALLKVPKKTVLPEVEVKKVISIEEMIDKLTQRITQALSFNFREFSGAVTTKEEKVTVIVGFLAVLELARQGILNLVQENNFDDIYVEKQTLIVSD